MRAFPIEKERQKLTRPYVANVIYTILGDEFSKWVDKKIDQRNKKVKEENNMMIDMDEDIAKVFRESTSVSLTKGNSAHLMKISSKRRRTKREIEEEKQEDLLQKVEFAKKMQEFEQLKAKMA